MSRISPLPSSSQKPTLPNRTAERTFHQTITQSANGPVLVLARKPQPRLHRLWPYDRLVFFAATKPRSPTACSRLRTVRAARSILHLRPKIRGGQPAVDKQAVFSYSSDLRASTSCPGGHRASLSMLVDNREDRIVVEAQLSGHGMVTLALLQKKDSPHSRLHIKSSFLNHD